MNSLFLPMTLSSLTFHALDCLRRAELDPRYTIDMGSWHEPEEEEETGEDGARICYAGSVMAFGLGAVLDENCEPTDFSRYNSRRLAAINYVRAGEVEDALDAMEVPVGRLPDPLRNVDVIPYGNSPREFRRQQRELAGALFDAGF